MNCRAQSKPYATHTILKNNNNKAKPWNKALGNIWFFRFRNDLVGDEGKKWKDTEKKGFFKSRPTYRDQNVCVEAVRARFSGRGF